MNLIHCARFSEGLPAAAHQQVEEHLQSQADTAPESDTEKKQAYLKAALELAQELNPGAPFQVVWEAARELSPAAFE